MTIDWFTFTAQILNFLVLVWLMKRFLYGPIIAAMDSREANIAARWNDAEKTQKSAELQQSDFERRTRELQEEREAVLSALHRDVEAWRSEHMQQAKQEVEVARDAWHRSLQRDKQTLIAELQLDSAKHATDVARHLLTKLADTSVETQMVTRFLKELESSGDQLQKILEQQKAGSCLDVVTSHPLNSSDCDRIRMAIQQAGNADLELDFQQSPELICGIELRAGGNKFSWTIQDSIAELESNLIDAIEASVPAFDHQPHVDDGASTTSAKIE